MLQEWHLKKIQESPRVHKSNSGMKNWKISQKLLVTDENHFDSSLSMVGGYGEFWDSVWLQVLSKW